MQYEIAESGWSALLALQRATHATLQVLAAELVDLDLTASEINALANLPTTLTSVLDRLERRGHISRGARPGDRRVVLIGLTASGQATAGTIRQAIAALEARALAALPPAAIAGFRDALDALTEVSA